MVEHRLIERMLAVIKDALAKIETTHKVDPVFVDTAVDFIRFYADRTHHGKEEDILFRESDKRPLSANDRRIMNELVEEHVVGRQATKALVDANNRYRKGDEKALIDIADYLRKLVEFYPKHIEKEDKVFFPAARAYVTESEDQDMLAEFWEFDRKMIHEKYESMVDGLKKSRLTIETDMLKTRRSSSSNGGRQLTSPGNGTESLLTSIISWVFQEKFDRARTKIYGTNLL
jgi:hemerythrin-like domain-containing protein